MKETCSSECKGHEAGWESRKSWVWKVRSMKRWKQKKRGGNIRASIVSKIRWAAKNYEYLFCIIIREPFFRCIFAKCSIEILSIFQNFEVFRAASITHITTVYVHLWLMTLSVPISCSTRPALQTIWKNSEKLSTPMQNIFNTVLPYSILFQYDSWLFNLVLHFSVWYIRPNLYWYLFTKEQPLKSGN